MSPIAFLVGLAAGFTIGYVGMREQQRFAEAALEFYADMESNRSVVNDVGGHHARQVLARLRGEAISA